jgi:hypothetical protein
MRSTGEKKYEEHSRKTPLLHKSNKGWMNGVFNIIPIREFLNEPSVEPSEIFSCVKLIHKPKRSHDAI